MADRPITQKDQRELDKILEKVRDIFRDHGEDLASGEENLIISAPKKLPRFPWIIVYFSVVKDLLDGLDFTGIGAIVTTIISLIASIVLLIWGLGKLSGGWWKKDMIRRLWRNLVITILGEFIPLLKIIPATLIFTLMTHFRETKVVKLFNLALETLREYNVLDILEGRAGVPKGSTPRPDPSALPNTSDTRADSRLRMSPEHKEYAMAAGRYAAGSLAKQGAQSLINRPGKNPERKPADGRSPLQSARSMRQEYRNYMKERLDKVVPGAFDGMDQAGKELFKGAVEAGASSLVGAPEVGAYLGGKAVFKAKDAFTGEIRRRSGERPANDNAPPVDSIRRGPSRPASDNGIQQPPAGRLAA
jgi:hypothetical protein